MNKMVDCQLCGEPMPPSEEMFYYHGFSGPCPQPNRKEYPENKNNIDIELDQIKQQSIPWLVGHIEGAFRTIPLVMKFKSILGEPSTQIDDTPSYQRTMKVIQVLQEKLKEMKIYE